MCAAATHRASTEAKPAHTHMCDILPLSSSLLVLVISPLMVSDSVSLLTHTNIAAQLDVTMAAVATTLGLPRVP